MEIYCFIQKRTYRMKISANIKLHVLDTVYTRCEESLINIMSKYLRKIPCYEVCSMSALYFVIMSDSQTLHIYLKIHIKVNGDPLTTHLNISYLNIINEF